MGNLNQSVACVVPTPPANSPQKNQETRTPELKNPRRRLYNRADRVKSAPAGVRGSLSRVAYSANQDTPETVVPELNNAQRTQQQNLETETADLDTSSRNNSIVEMRSGPIYASPPTADGKRSVSKLSFRGEGEFQEIVDFPQRPTIPNPPRSKEAAAYLKPTNRYKKKTQQINYFNISASSISIGSR